ncbi:MAG TPA: hypothetical protein PLU39_02875 [Armatimonadota bacterium]|nr:hypothetical protein [Armatimonadota bacterium]HOJ20225.1 hypothetical protein [Armatimonadota bacterium]HOM81016.1 hypothetical protein [Armatimonadota bacterium]HPO74448.1 hypothetical protein [Armatimonadota bacterium]HPT96790.1 hypothetical protein [Armatimonadota bacterium]
MGSAYTPGLKVSPFITIQKTRRLPLKGQVLVAPGDHVEPSTPVARTELPGNAQMVRAAQMLGIEPREIWRALLKQAGDSVQKGELLAETRSFFGLFRATVTAPISGTIESVSDTTGNITIREAPIPVEVPAYVEGTIVEVLPGEGVVVEARGAFIQGIFGVGGEREGKLRVVVSGPDQPLDEAQVPAECAGEILIGGSLVTGAALRAAAKAGAAGIVAGGIIDQELMEFLGHDIGVAITGHENIHLTLMVTEGFGEIRMAERTFELLRSLDGRRASINGATQIRAGVIRPEIIVPRTQEAQAGMTTAEDESALEIGTRIRVIREPYFGRLGRVATLPPEPQQIPTGASVRVLGADLDGGEHVVIPRANVEIIVE